MPAPVHSAGRRGEEVTAYNVVTTRSRITSSLVLKKAFGRHELVPADFIIMSRTASDVYFHTVSWPAAVVEEPRGCKVLFAYRAGSTKLPTGLYSCTWLSDMFNILHMADEQAPQSIVLALLLPTFVDDHIPHHMSRMANRMQTLGASVCPVTEQTPQRLGGVKLP